MTPGPRDTITPQTIVQIAQATDPGPPAASALDIEAADGSTFAPALRLLSGGVREDVHLLYRVLRTLDDLVDEDDPRAAARVNAVERWAHGERARDTPETRALARLARHHPLPRGSLLEFCAGMRHDLARVAVDTDADFMRYCQRAGGSVGVVLASLLGCARNTPAGRRELYAGMATLGCAMQVTNILRDIDEDLEHGRVYIARAAIERFGLPLPGAREQLLRELIGRADALYEQGASAIPLLRDGRAAMALASDLYREILRQIEREGFGRRPGRVVVPARRRRALIAKHQGANVTKGVEAG